MTIPSKAPLPEEISLPIGYHSDFLKYGIRQPVIIKPFAPPAVAICGASGSGKTFLETQLLARLVRHKEFEVVLADFKGIDFNWLSGCGHYYQHMQVGSALDYVIDRMNERMANTQRTYYHPIFFVFDEYAAWLSLLDKKQADLAKQKLSSLLMLARGCGITLILSMQRLDASNFNSARDNIGHIIAMGNLSNEAKRMVCPDYKELLEPQPRGEGYLITAGGVPTPLTVPDVRDKERMKHRIYDALKSADERFPIDIP